MIRSITLKNYRCFEDSQISFKNLTLIVGSNNAGKSTLIEAMRVIGLVVRRFQHTTYSQPPIELGLPAITKGIVLRVDDLRIDLRTIIYQYKEDTCAEIIAHFDDRTIIHVFLTPQTVFAQIMVDGKMIKNKGEALRVKGLNLHIMPQIGLIQEDEPRLTTETVSRDIETRLSSRHFRNEVYQYKDDYFDSFREIAQRTWPGLRIQEISYDIGENRVSLIVHDSGYSAEVGLMGSGLQMWLQIVWFISHNSSDATVVLDEPDIYMHPDLQRKVLALVEKKFKQVIIATHSIEIISAVDPEEIVTVDKKTRKMKYVDGYIAVQQVINNLGSNHNLSLARLGTAKKCVFVEGKDIKTLAKLQKIMGIESNVSVDQLPIVELGGWARFGEALGAARLFHDQTSGTIRTYCILDRDYHTQEEIDKLYQRAKESNLLLHIWQKKEIENYLLTPSSLFKISEEPEENREVFLRELFDMIDMLRDQTIDHIMDQLHTQDRSKEPSYSRKAAQRILDLSWNTLEGRMALVNGKELISAVNEWMMYRYHKSCSRAKMIQSLCSEDIPIEVGEVISNLCE